MKLSWASRQRGPRGPIPDSCLRRSGRRMRQLSQSLSGPEWRRRHVAAKDAMASASIAGRDALRVLASAEVSVPR
jgi:hypothetical protein